MVGYNLLSLVVKSYSICHHLDRRPPKRYQHAINHGASFFHEIMSTGRARACDFDVYGVQYESIVDCKEGFGFWFSQNRTAREQAGGKQCLCDTHCYSILYWVSFRDDCSDCVKYFDAVING